MSVLKKKNEETYNLKKTDGSSLKKKKRSNPLARLGAAITAVIFVAACVFEIISTQAEIAEKKQELNALIKEAELLEDANDEYQSMLSENDERAFMERYAVEMLGYAYPNERRFYDTTGN